MKQSLKDLPITIIVIIFFFFILIALAIGIDRKDVEKLNTCQKSCLQYGFLFVKYENTREPTCWCVDPETNKPLEVPL